MPPPLDYLFQFTAFCTCGWLLLQPDGADTVYCNNPVCKSCMVMFKVSITLLEQEAETV